MSQCWKTGAKEAKNDILTSIVELKKFSQKQCHSVCQEFFWHLFFTVRIDADDSRDGPLGIKIGTLHLVRGVAEGAINCESSNRSICKTLLSLTFENSLRQSRAWSIFTVMVGWTRVILVFFGINTETLSHEVYLNPINVFNQTSDRGHQLLDDVPVDIWLQLATTLHHLVERVGSFFKWKFGCLLLSHTPACFRLLSFICVYFADDVSDEIVHQIWWRFDSCLN